jgi:hypothetical protein
LYICIVNMTKHKQNTMKTLTQTQIQELGLIYFSRKDAMKKDIIEVAKTAKAMSLYLGCDFKQGISILHDMQLAESEALHLLLSK